MYKALISLFCLHHSWIWSEIWVALFHQKLENRSVRASYRISLNWLRNTFPKSKKLSNVEEGSSISHFAATLVKVLSKILNRTVSSFSEFEEHHRWKVVIWAPGSSITFPSKLGMSEGNLLGTGGHVALVTMGHSSTLTSMVSLNVTSPPHS